MVLKQVLGLRGYIPFKRLNTLLKSSLAKQLAIWEPVCIYIESLKTQKLENLPLRLEYKMQSYFYLCPSPFWSLVNQRLLV